MRTSNSHWKGDPHVGFVNEVLENTPEHYDGDEAAETIAIRYVRDLEFVAKAARALLDGTGASSYLAANGRLWRVLQYALADIEGSWTDELSEQCSQDAGVKVTHDRG